MGTSRCPRCGKTHPLCLPPYMRVEKDEDGLWRPMDYDICKCDREAYEFLVVGLAEKKNREEQRKKVRNL